MYQLPVESLDKIRNSRKRVKSILCDIGLESCKNLLEELKCFDAGDECFENTEWDDFTDGFDVKRRKKWVYRTERLCCALCWFSTHSMSSFRAHVVQRHEEEEDLTDLTTCPSCPFTAHDDIVVKHIKRFKHKNPGTLVLPRPKCIKTSKPVRPLHHTQTIKPLICFSTTNVGDKYSCRNCGFHDSLIYVMRKHVLVNHYRPILTRYFGQRSAAEQTTAPGGPKKSQFYCRVCTMPAETLEHLIYHVLSSDKHREVHTQISPTIVEHVPGRISKNGSPQGPLNLTEGSVQKVVSLVSKSSHLAQDKGPSSGTVLLAPPSAPTALVCSSTGQVLLPHQVSSKGLILTGSAVGALQNNPTTLKNAPMGMLLNTSKQQPMTVGVSQQQPITVGVSQQQSRQVLLPPGVQIVQNKPGVGGNQPLMLTQRLPGPQAAPGGQMLSNTQQSIRLVPTGNRVNGMPTYTLETVQVTAGVTQVVSKAPILVTAQQQPGQIPTVSVLGNGMVPNQRPGSVSKLPSAGSSSSDRPRQLVVRTQFLKRMRNTVKCTRCQILLSDKGIFQHLLHGLRCVFCPLVFYSISQVMEHCTQEHNLDHSANRDRLNKEFALKTDEQGHLVIPTFDMRTSVPQDLLGFKHLNLVLVTDTPSRDKIYLQMSEEAGKSVCPTLPKDGCPFCPEKPQNSMEYEKHLRVKHHIVPTIHAILKTPAFKCVYCLGVYADKSTTKTVSIHVQRCRCAPKAAKDAERLINPDPNSQTQTVNGGVPPPALDKGKDQGQGKAKAQGKNAKDFSFDPSVPMALDPTGMEMRSFEERKLFLGRYFNRKPYLSRQELEALAGRLWYNRTDVATLFGTKRSRCLKAIERRRTSVFLGFNMTELSKLKHNLLLPEVGLSTQPRSKEPPVDTPTEGE